ncbi:hypothetical protein [Bradyrhizobium sp. HKCCYLS20291]|uniref:hypothetical protein n=1 Tax=Bradyrhizobium sp. HKCCYLS20291 TaxID=3420766 RepID=UPI003EBBB277
MVGRALNLAAVVAVVCMGLAGAAMAQENLDAGKSPAQIYNGTCVACHKSPRGLVKNTSPGSLPGFLRQHYTTSPEMAGVLANYVLANGGTDVRASGHRDGKETRSERRSRAATEPAEAKPAAADNAAAGAAEPRRRSGHHSRRSEPKPDAASDNKDQVVAPADGEGSGSGAKSKRGKRKKPAQEGAASDDTRSESTGATRPAVARDDNAVRAEPPRVETPKSSDAAPALRADPVPPVTPAPDPSAPAR